MASLVSGTTATAQMVYTAAVARTRDSIPPALRYDVARNQKECDQGIPLACSNLGESLLNAYGIKRDLKAALRAWQRGCEGGDGDSCKEMYVSSYYWGGLKLNSDERIKLLEKACDYGSAGGCHVLATVYEDKKALRERAPSAYERACDGGVRPSCDLLATLYKKGRLVPENRAKASSLEARGCGRDGSICYAQHTAAEKTRKSVLKAMQRGEEIQQASLSSEPARAEASGVEKKRGGGFMKSALGAAGGLLAAKAAGANAEQTIGAMAKAAALVNPESEAAAAAGVVGDLLLQGGGGNAGIMAPALAPPPQASFATKPNLATGTACAGFTLENYRTKAFEHKDSRMQLYTMCGQAFEYYSSYLRAIKQGYSEADANRTYAAHQASARTATTFYNSTR